MINNLITFSILFPILMGIIFFIIKNKKIRNFGITCSSIILIVVSVYFYLNGSFVSNLASIGNIKLSTIIIIADITLMLVLLIITIKYKNYLSIILILLQLFPLLYFEFVTKPHIDNSNGYVSFFNDELSTIMILLVFIVGSLIAFFSIGYMDEFEQHMESNKSKQPLFYFIIFLFLGAMVGIVLSNNLLNMYFFWEITTLCSFILIGYKGNEESIKNSFNALWMNLLGGVAFLFAIILFYSRFETIEISKILELGISSEMYLPLSLICIAALTKAAQFPFHSWLLGAMVAPTPVSALLHSSTMVKAGVYLLIRFSPLFEGTKLGATIAVIGGFTFFGASVLAITQSNAKKVLAYSTISNLGLIVATCGIATPIAISAAILLVVFHGVSKALLFLCVGTIEHAIGSRDIEDMEGLISKMPMVGFISSVGMISMLLAPFGVIVTKILGIEAATKFPLILILIVLGSTLTVVYWTRWLGKILSVSNEKTKTIESYSIYNMLPLTLLTSFVIVVSLSLTKIYNHFIDPYINRNWDIKFRIDIDISLFTPIFIGLVILIMIIPIVMMKKNKFIYKNPYMCGENSSEGNSFVSNFDKIQDTYNEEYYFHRGIDEKKISIVFNIISIVLIIYLLGGIR